jgi:predicted kinase
VNVILENGFWSRAERDWYRAQAQSVGAHVILHYLAAEREELWARLEQRNAALPPGTFAVSRAELDLWWSWFEPPTPDEFERPAS